MPTIHLETFVKAEVAYLFDLARSAKDHVASASHTQERIVWGPHHNILESGDEVMWEARHFGIRLRMTVKISELKPFREFVDEQVAGPFKWMRHRHVFISAAGGTIMVDDFEYGTPVGVLGALADHLFIHRHMKQFLLRRNSYLKQRAEAADD